MRPPFSAIDPDTDGVSTRMRGERASAASRVSALAAAAAPGSVDGLGTAGCPSRGEGAGSPGFAPCAVCAVWAACFCRSAVGTP
jgi:hypothetical protein